VGRERPAGILKDYGRKIMELGYPNTDLKELISIVADPLGIPHSPQKKSKRLPTPGGPSGRVSAKDAALGNKNNTLWKFLKKWAQRRWTPGMKRGVWGLGYRCSWGKQERGEGRPTNLYGGSKDEQIQGVKVQKRDSLAVWKDTSLGANAKWEATEMQRKQINFQEKKTISGGLVGRSHTSGTTEIRLGDCVKS